MKIAIVGYGVMGQAVDRLSGELGGELQAQIVARFGSGDPPLTQKALSGAEVAIEFAGPEGAPDRICQLAGLSVPVVSGSTGWEGRFDEVRERVRQDGGALLHAPNLSLGVALFARVVREAARVLNVLPEYRLELEETHHTRKVDHPSGTARWLSDEVVRRVRRLKRWEEIEGERDSTEQDATEQDAAERSSVDNVLRVRAFREGDVPGTHLVRAIGPVDRIELRHEALNRDGFARGALETAGWLRGRSGVFTLDDFLRDRLSTVEGQSDSTGTSRDTNPTSRGGNDR